MSDGKFLNDQWYVIDGEVMNRLWRLTEHLTEGSKMLDEKRQQGVGKAMQLHLERASRLAKKMRLGG